MPDLHFKIIEAAAIPFAAVPTLLFKVSIENKTAEEQVQSIMLRSQIRIEATRRRYDPETEKRLLDVFGEPSRWGETLRSLLWTHSTVIVPQFAGGTVAEIPIACTYDFEVVGSKYFYALEEGEAPLNFLFSGTIFYVKNGAALQVTQIPWEKEAQFQMPISIWNEMMDRYFPNSAWLRLRKDTFDRLYQYKAQNTLPTWEAALERLLRNSER